MSLPLSRWEGIPPSASPLWAIQAHHASGTCVGNHRPAGQAWISPPNHRLHPCSPGKLSPPGSLHLRLTWWGDNFQGNSWRFLAQFGNFASSCEIFFEVNKRTSQVNQHTVVNAPPPVNFLSKWQGTITVCASNVTMSNFYGR